MARKSPLPEFKQLDAPKADAKKVAEEIAKQKGVTQALAPKSDPKEWAKIIVKRYESGEKIRPLTLKFAKQALGIEGKA